MREIIYIQAGSLSNYTGTHFWNTQENYFVYDEDDISITDHSISFKEGRDEDKQPTLCPRLLAFDEKSNFGTLARESRQEVALESPTTWEGSLVQQEQERIPRSEYHSSLDSEDRSEHAGPIASKIRYWSDFSRVFFDPKSIQPVPDAQGLVEGDWNASRESFSRCDDGELIDGPLRLLVEECDNFQGIQMIQDTSIFGGFSNSLLSAFREEHSKASIVAFACLSSIGPFNVNLGNSHQVKQVLNDALSLRGVAELCDLNVPILSPSLWERDSWLDGYAIDNKSVYQSSAILSAHIETATLPTRLRDDWDDLQSMVANMNRGKSSRFSSLHGTVCPHVLSAEKIRNIASLSAPSEGERLFARRDVSRGFSQADIVVYNAWSRAYELKEPFLTRHHLPSYPIPTSFLQIFPDVRPNALKMVSSLSASSSTGGQLSSYAHFAEGVAKRRDSALLAMELEEDEVRELISALWDIAYDYEADEDGGDKEEGMGEDEE